MLQQLLWQDCESTSGAPNSSSITQCPAQHFRFRCGCQANVTRAELLRPTPATAACCRRIVSSGRSGSYTLTTSVLTIGTIVEAPGAAGPQRSSSKLPNFLALGVPPTKIVNIRPCFGSILAAKLLLLLPRLLQSTLRPAKQQAGGGEAFSGWKRFSIGQQRWTTGGNCNGRISIVSQAINF